VSWSGVVVDSPLGPLYGVSRDRRPAAGGDRVARLPCRGRTIGLRVVRV